MPDEKQAPAVAGTKPIANAVFNTAASDRFRNENSSQSSVEVSPDGKEWMTFDKTGMIAFAPVVGKPDHRCLLFQARVDGKLNMQQNAFAEYRIRKADGTIAPTTYKGNTLVTNVSENVYEFFVTPV